VTAFRVLLDHLGIGVGEPARQHRRVALAGIGPAGRAMSRQNAKGRRVVPRGVGSGGRTRTYDPTVNSRLLYRLSYAGTERAAL
jgi:hypothetical protein